MKKLTVLLLVIGSFCFSSCKKETNQNVNNINLTSVDLSGKWSAYGYQCTDYQDLEIVEITHDGTHVTAVKTIGDQCVTKGNITFEGEFTQNPFFVSFTLGNPTNPNSTIQPGYQMTLITPNYLRTDIGIVYMRKKTYFP